MPVLARVRSQTTMLSRIHLGVLPANTTTQAAEYDPQQMPLEVIVPGGDQRAPFSTLSTTGAIVNAYEAIRRAEAMTAARP